MNNTHNTITDIKKKDDVSDSQMEVDMAFNEPDDYLVKIKSKVNVKHLLHKTFTKT